MRWITWVEPFSACGEPCYCVVSEKAAVEVMRSAALVHPKKHKYSSDQEALEDFMTVHWAGFCEKPLGAKEN
jgi:hypothetical protein